MNVLCAAYYSPPTSGNFIGSLLDLGLKMRENGDALFFVFPKTANTLSEKPWVKWLEREGFQVFLVDTSESNEKQLEALKNLIKTWNIDILHIHFDLFLNFAIHNRQELETKIIVHEHMEYPAGCNRFIQGLKYFRRSLIFRKNQTAVVCVNRFVNRAHVGAKHWFVPNGLSMKRHLPTDKSMERTECRNLLEIEEDEKLVLFLGWDLQRKGLDVAVKAIAESRKSGNNIILGVVGLGSRPNVLSRGTEYINKTTGIDPDEKWIHYLPSTEDMFAYMRAADVYLSSSRSEAFSYGILEAISQKSKVVVSDIKGTNWCWEYKDAYVYPVEDYERCADAIQKALNNNNQDNNYKEICKRYSIDKWCEQIQDIYRKVI